MVHLKPGLFTLCAAAVALAAAGGPSEARSPPRPEPQPDARDLRAFPDAARGQVRRVIRLPPARDEGALKVELIVGRTVLADCNQRAFGGKLEQRTAQGWGYDYYVLRDLTPGPSTLMACPRGAAQRRFVGVADETLIRYNSRLPLVVYTPRDVELRYRVWQAGPEQQAP
ncbi:MAG: serine protease inhibitor ecotin [Caulobacteraceae bacterium]|nr:serine protease inhibitor ecotin [Caulobacteraceae bacterium]